METLEKAGLVRNNPSSRCDNSDALMGIVPVTGGFQGGYLAGRGCSLESVAEFLKGASYFESHNLLHGRWQMPGEDEDEEASTMITQGGLFSPRWMMMVTPLFS